MNAIDVELRAVKATYLYLAMSIWHFSPIKLVITLYFNSS